MTKKTAQKMEIDLKKIESLYPEISSFYHQIEDILSEQLVSKMRKIKDEFHSAFAKKWEQEHIIFTKNSNALDKIASEYKLKSCWSISEIPAEELKNSFSKKKVKALVYENEKIEINAAVSWLDMWKYADKIIKMSGDEHHIFIEHFIEKKPGEYELVTGS